MKVRLIDDQFTPGNLAGNGLIYDIPTKIEWTRDRNKDTEIIFFTDTSFHLVDNFQAKYKIAWVLESPDILPYQRNWLRENLQKFDKVITFDRDLLQEFPEKCLMYCLGGTWIKPEDQKIYPKTKNTSIIASVKNQTTGHRLRHQIVQAFGNRIDFVCGNGYFPLAYKLDGLRDFRFSFVIENTAKDYYFSEKLTDAFLSGTIPIYFGCDISNFFDTRGMILINNIADINMARYSEKTYEQMFEYVKKNFEIAQRYKITEDYIYDNVLVKYFWDCL